MRFKQTLASVKIEWKVKIDKGGYDALTKDIYNAVLMGWCWNSSL